MPRLSAFQLHARGVLQLSRPTHGQAQPLGRYHRHRHRHRAARRRRIGGPSAHVVAARAAGHRRSVGLLKPELIDALRTGMGITLARGLDLHICRNDTHTPDPLRGVPLVGINRVEDHPLQRGSGVRRHGDQRLVARALAHGAIFTLSGAAETHLVNCVDAGLQNPAPDHGDELVNERLAGYGKCILEAA